MKAVMGQRRKRLEDVYNTEDHVEIVQWDMMKSLICENMSMKYTKKKEYHSILQAFMYDWMWL